MYGRHIESYTPRVYLRVALSRVIPQGGSKPGYTSGCVREAYIHQGVLGRRTYFRVGRGRHVPPRVGRGRHVPPRVGYVHPEVHRWGMCTLRSIGGDMHHPEPKVGICTTLSPKVGMLHPEDHRWVCYTLRTIGGICTTLSP